MPLQSFISNLFEPKTHGPEIAAMMASLLGVKISATTLTKEIEEHPDSPSLLSISDVLNNYGIENLAIKVSADKLAELPFPLITQIQDTKGHLEYFTVIKEVADNSVLYFDPEQHKWTSGDRDEFVNRFSGVVLLAQANEKAGERDYEKKINLQIKVRLGQYALALCLPILLFVASAIAFTQVGMAALLPFIFSVITLMGCAISTLLLWYEVDQLNPALQQMCKAGSKVNCTAVLQSNAANIAGISWSAIGFTYFIGILLLLLFGGLANPVTLLTISWVNILALPYVAFSIYYQWRVVKQWCALCLGVQAMLALQFAVALTGNWHSLMPFSTLFMPLSLLQAIVAFVLPFIAVAIALPALQKAKESKRATIELQKVKHNRQIFEPLLQKQKEVFEAPTGLGISLGNANATYKLIKVCNPYCGPCAKAHQPIGDLLHHNPDLQVQILFTATNDENDVRTPPVKHLLAIAENSDEAIIKQALDDWYHQEHKDYGKFAGQYPMNGALNLQDNKVAAMKEWCDKVVIDFTPTFFIGLSVNGDNSEMKYYQLPKLYNVNDLKYFFSV